MSKRRDEIVKSLEECIEEFDASFQDLSHWKDFFLNKNFSVTVKSQFALAFSAIVRQYVYTHYLIQEIKIIVTH